MNIKHILATALTASVILAAPAFAGDHKEGHRDGYAPQHREYSNHTKYEWSLEPGQKIIFKNPVSFEGKVTGVNASHTLIKADNGMLIEVPNQALIWNGDTQVFAQNANLNTDVVVHLRAEEPYQVMSERSDELAIGSYEGVFWVSKAFIRDIALDELDGDIYRDTADVPLYDNDLKSAEDRD